MGESFLFGLLRSCPKALQNTLLIRYSLVNNILSIIGFLINQTRALIPDLSKILIQTHVTH